MKETYHANKYPKDLDKTDESTEAFTILATGDIDKNHALQWAFGWFEKQLKKNKL